MPSVGACVACVAVAWVACVAGGSVAAGDEEDDLEREFLLRDFLESAGEVNTSKPTARAKMKTVLNFSIFLMYEDRTIEIGIVAVSGFNGFILNPPVFHLPSCQVISYSN